jgi:hypothetical protein
MTFPYSKLTITTFIHDFPCNVWLVSACEKVQYAVIYYMTFGDVYSRVCHIYSLNHFKYF